MVQHKCRLCITISQAGNHIPYPVERREEKTKETDGRANGEVSERQWITCGDIADDDIRDLPEID